jgi:phosphomannomutase
MNLVARAHSWLDQDPDPITRAELAEILQRGDQKELSIRFGARLEFGTAGLRGELGAGPNRMNQVVVAQTALGLSRFLIENRDSYLDPKGELSVVIGYDARVNSDVFAKLSAEILAAQGIKAKLFSMMVPTPVAAFTGKLLGSSATVVVTASHNPPRDNGYKVYLGGKNGHSQLVPPQDAEIATHIQQIANSTSFTQIERDNSYEALGVEQVDAYANRAVELIPPAEQKPERENLRIAYTAMHGVGFDHIEKIFTQAGFKVASVKAQEVPDGSFPTVSFPNPEEPGAMDLALELAKEIGADLVLANDPDADRLAVGYGSPPRMLTGDQVGTILADRMASKGAKVIANSIVSQDLSSIANHHGVSYSQTLTGFKWISKVSGLQYGYEEALGYCVDPEFTPDKDGITSALLIAELASDLRAKGQNLGDEIARLAALYGQSATGQVSIRVQDLGLIKKVMDSLRLNPPREILGESVLLDDYEQKPGTQKTNALVFKAESLKVIFRPSGTEPKLKCYLQYTGDDSDLKLHQLESWARELIEELS